MNEWPAGWYRDDQAGNRAGGVPQPAGGAADPTARMSGGRGPGRPGAAGAWPSQPPLRSTGRPGAASPPGAGTWAPSRPRVGGPPRGGRGGWGPRRIAKVAGVVIAAVAILVVGFYLYLNGKLTRQNVLAGYSGRPAAGAGQNWLITGSDSRQGLSKAQMAKLATGFNVSGQRSDTVMVLHIPANGGPSVLVSIPRDSYVPIPGVGMNKINAAYSYGGPKLLAQTIQNVTGLRIDHYMGIGFGGLVNVVNAVGGVHMCLPTAITDPAAGLHLKAGCQNLNGAEALGFVRTRHNFALQDLQRIQDQRLFLSALLRKVTSTGTLINPFASIPAANGAASTLTVDSGTQLYQLLQVAFALRHPETTTVPIANANYLTPAGDAVQWDSANAKTLFNDLQTDQPVPKSLLTGSQLG